MKTKVFISYAKEDKDFVNMLYADLREGGIEPWVDTFDLIPGQDWDKAIRDAIGQCSYFVAILSERSVTKSGYVQTEIRKALEIADRHPEGKIFIIPIRIDNCEPSFEKLRKLHRADFFPDYEQGLNELLRVFNYMPEEKPALININVEKRDGLIARVTARGFGFIAYSHVKPDIFFHANELQNVMYEELREGDIVLFSIAEGPKGRVAVEVERA